MQTIDEKSIFQQKEQKIKYKSCIGEYQQNKMIDNLSQEN